MGNTLKLLGKLDDALEAYKKAISIKPDYALAYCNMGTTLKDKDKRDEAIGAYNKAISIKPDYAEVYRYLSNITKYKKNDPHLEKIKKLYHKKL